MENDNLWNQSHTLYSTTNSKLHRRFIVPVPNTPKRKWWQFRKKRNDKNRYHNNIRMTISDYKEDIDWESNGEVIVNGQGHTPYNRQIWIPPNLNNNNNNNQQ
jgi:hypothetical protein